MKRGENIIFVRDLEFHFIPKIFYRKSSDKSKNYWKESGSLPFRYIIEAFDSLIN